MISIVSDEEDETATKAIAPKQARAGRRVLVGTAQSRGKDSLPLWIQPVFESSIVPTILEFYGSVDNPWDRDQNKSNFFLGFLQDLIDKCCPEQHYVVQTKEADRIWYHVRH